jgi:hypothetical protein
MVWRPWRRLGTLDVVVGEGSSVVKLLSSEDKTLLIRRDTFFVLNLLLDVFNGIARLNFEKTIRKLECHQYWHQYPKSYKECITKLIIFIEFYRSV